MKKRHLIVSAMTLLLCVMLLPFFTVQAAPGAPYVAFGDSIAAGYGLSSREKEAYPALLADTFGFSLSNLARDGQTSTGLRERIASLSPEERDAVSGATLITISIGGNDLIGEENRGAVLAEALISALSGDYSMSDNMLSVYTTLKNNLTEIITALRAMNPNAVIILQTLYNPYLIGDYTYYGYNIGDQLNFYVQKINETYDEVLRETGGFVIADTAGAMNGVPEYFYTTFDFHPTAAGHVAIAGILADTYRHVTGTPNPAETTSAEIPAETTTPAASAETTADQTTPAAETDPPQTTSAVPETSSKEITAPTDTADSTVPAAATPADNTGINERHVFFICMAVFCVAVLFLLTCGVIRNHRKA